MYFSFFGTPCIYICYYIINCPIAHAFISCHVVSAKGSLIRTPSNSVVNLCIEGKPRR